MTSLQPGYSFDSMNNTQQALQDAYRLAQQQPTEAEKLCRNVLQQMPALPEAVNILAITLHMQSKSDDAIMELQKALETHPTNTLLLASLGEAYAFIHELDKAEEVLQRSVSLNSKDDLPLLGLGKILNKLGRFKEAEKVLRQALTIQQAQNYDNDTTYHLLSHALMPGDDYHHYLSSFHQWIQPSAYLEIGIETGKTLKLAQSGTVAIGVDPNPVIQVPLPDSTKVFKLESDTFFEQHDLAQLIGKPTLDFAFIDGLHVFYQALRDFINVEKFCRPDTVVLIHDCLPLDRISSEPVRTTNVWSGDPWKVMAVLRKYRPDLTCFTIPTRPTGLGVITNLNPENTVLDEQYNEIIATYRNRDYDWLKEEGLKETLGVFTDDWDQIVGRIKAAHTKHNA